MSTWCKDDLHLSPYTDGSRGAGQAAAFPPGATATVPKCKLSYETLQWCLKDMSSESSCWVPLPSQAWDGHRNQQVSSAGLTAVRLKAQCRVAVSSSIPVV